MFVSTFLFLFQSLWFIVLMWRTRKLQWKAFMAVLKTVIIRAWIQYFLTLGLQMNCCIEHWESNVEAFNLIFPMERGKNSCTCTIPKVKGRMLVHLQHSLSRVWIPVHVYRVAETLSATVRKLVSDMECYSSSVSQRLAIARRTDPREIFTSTPTQRLWLFSCLDTHLLCTGGAAESIPGLSSCSTVYAQRKALTLGRHTPFYP